MNKTVDPQRPPQKLKAVMAMAFLLSALHAHSAIYHVDARLGVDTNDGRTMDTPWKTIGRVNEASLAPGDSVLFKRGEIWRESLLPQSGSASGYITYGAYGTGSLPRLLGSVQRNAASDWLDEGGNLWSAGGGTDTLIGGELLSNPSFDTNESGWALYFNEGAGASAPGSGRTTAAGEYDSAPAGYKLVCASNGAVVADLQFFNSIGFSVTSGLWYRLQFRAKSTIGFTNRYPLTLMQMNDPWFSYYTTSLGNSPVYSTAWTTHRVYFLADRTATDGRITWYLGATIPNGATLFLDTLSFQPCEKPVLLDKDVGNIIFDSEARCGVKKRQQSSLLSQGDFWHDFAAGRVKLCSTANPASVYSSIELALNWNAMETLGVSYVLFQDLDFRYWGRCINEAGGNHHLIFRSLRGSFIGGADMYSDYTVRYGNGIQFWRGAHDNRVEYCLLTEVYDAALTAQGLGTYEADHIFFRNNIIMNSEYSFEYWQRDASSQAHDIFFENNTCINAGSGWGHSQRWDGVNGRHVMIYDNTAATSNVWIRNNIFSGATESAVWIYNPDDVSELMMDHNDYDAATVGRIGSSNYATLADWQAASTRDAHSMAQPPLFVNAGAGDYRLQPGAPCIDKGTNASPSVDFDGVPRPLDGDYDGAALPDLGCFEFIHPLADSDADGLRDTNELAGVTSPVNPDCDDDRMNDGDETTAGTDPLDSGSVFALASSEPDAEGRLVLRWPSAAGRTYTLGQSTNLATGFSTLMEDLPASPPENTHTDTVSSLEFRLYRVKVRR